MKKHNKIEKMMEFFILFVLLGIILYFLINPATNVVKNRIQRNLTCIDLIFFDSDPTQRDVAWDSELPNLVEKDMKFALEHDIEIQYFFQGNIIKIKYNFEKEEWFLTIQSLNSYMPVYSVEEDFYNLKNFSMYKTDKSNIVIYGYRADKFERYEIGKSYYQEKTLTYDTNLPLTFTDKFISTINVLGYSMYEDEGKFYFYKDGKMVSSTEFPGEIKDIDIYNGFVINSKKQLHKMYVKKVNEIPSLNFVYIGQADRILSSSISNLGLGINLNMFLKNDEYCVAVPEEWEVCKNSWMEELEVTDYLMKLVNLEDVLSSAYFYYSKKDVKNPFFDYSLGKWNVRAEFVINGINFFYDFCPNGYDDSVILPEEVYKKYTKTVNSVDEYWANLEEIRYSYWEYYNHTKLNFDYNTF